MTQEEYAFDEGNDMFTLFFNSDYKEQPLELTSGNQITFLALKTAFTDSDLTGQILWPGCSLLLNWLDRNVSIFKDKTVVEVGAGTGICAVFATKFGNAAKGLATDGSEPLVDLMQKNIDLHGMADKVTCTQMKWIKEHWDKVVAEHGQFDFVIGSEIAYDENCVEGLIDTVDALLKPGGRFIIGHIDRYAMTTRSLLAKLARSGYEKEAEVPWGDLMTYTMELIVGSVMVWKRKCDP